MNMKFLIAGLVFTIFGQTSLAAFDCERYLHAKSPLGQMSNVFFKSRIQPRPVLEGTKSLFRNLAANYYKTLVANAKSNTASFERFGYVDQTGFKFKKSDIEDRFAEVDLFELIQRLIRSNNPDTKSLARSWATESPMKGKVIQLHSTLSEALANDNQAWATYENMLSFTRLGPKGSSATNQLEWSAFYALLYQPEPFSEDPALDRLQRNLFAVFTLNAHWVVLRSDMRGMGAKEETVEFTYEQYAQQRKDLVVEFMTDLLFYGESAKPEKDSPLP